MLNNKFAFFYTKHYVPKLSSTSFFLALKCLVRFAGVFKVLLAPAFTLLTVSACEHALTFFIYFVFIWVAKINEILSLSIYKQGATKVSK